MDQTLCDYYGQTLNYIEKMENITTSFFRDKENINSFSTSEWIKKILPATKAYELKRKIWNSIEFWATMPPLPNAIDVFGFLYETFDVYIISSVFGTGSKSPVEGKYKWIKTNFPYFPWENIIICHDRTVLDGDFIIDDLPRAIEKFKGKKIIIDYPYNRYFKADYRINNWREIKGILL